MVRTEFFPPFVPSTCTKKESNESDISLLQAEGDDAKAEDCPGRVPHVPYPAWVPHDCTAAVIVTATIHSL